MVEDLQEQCAIYIVLGLVWVKFLRCYVISVAYLDVGRRWYVRPILIPLRKDCIGPMVKVGNSWTRAYKDEKLE